MDKLTTKNINIKIETNYIFEGGHDKIKYNILHCDRKVNKNNESLFEFYRFLIRLRHDLLHYCVLYVLGLGWQAEDTVRNLLELNDPNSLLSKTPDILFKHFGEIIFIDVSVSRDQKVYEKLKSEKYLPVCSYLNREHKLKSSFIHLNINSSFRNLEKELNKISKYSRIDFPMHFFNECNEIIEDKKKMGFTIHRS
jgi:hypothetical protein